MQSSKIGLGLVSNSVVSWCEKWKWSWENHLHCVQEKVICLILVITSANVHWFSKFFRWHIQEKPSYVFVIKISTSSELCCYATLSKQPNYCWTNTFTRRKSMCFTWNLAKLNKVRSMYATKHYRYGLLNFYGIQNADSITTLRIVQNSSLVW